MSRRAALTLAASLAVAAALGTAAPAGAAPAEGVSSPLAVAAPAAVVVGGTPSYAAPPVTMWVSSTEIRTKGGSVSVSVSGPWTAEQLAESSLPRPAVVSGYLTVHDAFGFGGNAKITILDASGVKTLIPVDNVENPGTYSSPSRVITAGPTASFASWQVGATGAKNGIVFVDANLTVDGVSQVVGSQWVKYLPKG